MAVGLSFSCTKTSCMRLARASLSGIAWMLMASSASDRSGRLIVWYQRATAVLQRRDVLSQPAGHTDIRASWRHARRTYAERRGFGPGSVVVCA